MVSMIADWIKYNKVSFITLSQVKMNLFWAELKKISEDLSWDYWDKENFLKDLPQKWELSFYMTIKNCLIGYCIASEKSDCVWLHHLIISREKRYSGVGKIALQELERRTALFTYMNKIRLKVASTNAKAVLFYLKNGYEIVGHDKGNHVMEKIFRKKNNSIVVAIHQPNYIPWAGYFYKLLKSDIFVFLDDAQYTKNSFINRNRIKGSQGEQWITIPIRFKLGQAINQVEFADSRWYVKHQKSFDTCYKKAPYYEQYRDELLHLLSSNHRNLSELNIKVIEKVSNWLNITCEFVLSSQLGIESKSDDRLVDIVKKVGGRVYLSGTGGAKYQNEDKFNQNKITLKYYDFLPPVYPQIWGDFIPGLSILDLLFNCGPRAKNFIENSGANNSGSVGQVNLL